jgi:hypothetical protein
MQGVHRVVRANPVESVHTHGQYNATVARARPRSPVLPSTATFTGARSVPDPRGSASGLAEFC